MSDETTQKPKRWKEWFDANGEYLGERSGRTKPDAVEFAHQKCKCEQCNPPPEDVKP